MRRLLCAASLVGSVACSAGTIDPVKFERVSQAAAEIQVDLGGSKGVGSARLPDLLTQFEAQLADLEPRISGRREAAVLNAYADAHEAYQYFLRFKRLEPDAVEGQLLLRGKNRPIALRYRVPMESRGGGRWVSREVAMKVFAGEAEAALMNAKSLVQ